MTLYDTDFYAWTAAQAAALAAGDVAALDWQNLAEEIGDLGKNNRRELSSRLEFLLMHLLKWRHQPELRDASTWSSTIFTQRREIAKLIEQNPSLHRQVAPLMGDDYPSARRLASMETGLPPEAFDEACPWSPQQVLHEDFWPQETTP